MALVLYINGELTDLDSEQAIAQTRQVNDLNSLDNRQASYTNKFRLPKTANNIRIMNFLTLSGNDSNIPYQKNECSLYGESGECFIYKGWAIITDGGANYEAVVYDGIIDLYKAIENKTIADLNLANYNHDKSVAAVLNSWKGATPYIYLLGDYNGNTGDTANNKVNIDYVVPAIRAEYLWQQIFFNFDFNWQGSIFNNPDFKNLFITFPKGVDTVTNSTILYESKNYIFKSTLNSYDIGTGNEFPKLNKYFAHFTNTSIYEGGISHTNNIQLKVPETGSYIIEVSGLLNTKYLPKLASEGFDTNADVYLALNATGIDALQTSQYGPLLASNQQSKHEFITKRSLQLNAHDTLSIVVAPTQNKANTTFVMPPDNQFLTVKLTKVELASIDFNTAFTDFTLRDFIKEIMHRFGLTMYKDRTTDTYTFLTLKELLEDSGIIDWSERFCKKLSENYIYGNYAQRNWFRYKYNDKEASHHDGFIDVSNQNLEESKNILTSALHAPEKTRINYLGKIGNVYKLWEKEITEATESHPEKVDYKPLEKRYYFIKALQQAGPITVYSDATQEISSTDHYYRETHEGLPFTDVLQNYYGCLKKLLDRSKIITAELLLNENDIINLDLKKRYYIEQLGGNFIINKIINYIPCKPVKCEMIQVM